jgi:hypothetical protein
MKKDVDDPFIEKGEVSWKEKYTDEIVNNKKSEEVFKFPPSGREVSCFKEKSFFLSHDIRKGMNK